MPKAQQTTPAAAGDLRRTVTCILNDLEAGRREAADQLLPLVYDQLRAIAQQRMNDERAGHTLQATALVHEAYLRLVGDEHVAFKSRAHFYTAAVEAMRRIVVESARRKQRLRHGGDQQRVTLDEISLIVECGRDDLPDLDETLNRLAKADAEAAELVKL